MEYTEEELQIKYDQYVDEWNYSFGDGPLVFYYWKQDYLSKRTYSE